MQEGEKGYKVTFMVDKEKDFSEWYNTVIRQAEIIDDRYNLKGFVVYRPYGFYMLKGIAKLFEDELEKRGHQQVLFPVLIPEENLAKEEEHVEGFKAQVFWVTHGGDDKLEKRLALRPTSETAFYPMYALWIRGISDLPLKLYQTTTVYRYETKATKPLIRGREFYWIEAHDSFSSEEEALSQIEDDRETIEAVLLKELSIPFIFLRRPRWDKFRGAVDTYASDVMLPDGKMLQVASTHYLGTNFSKAFDIKFHDRDGKSKYVFQTCFGPGLTRILAAVISVHGDERGIIIPPKIAPIQVIIVPIPGPGVLDYARKLKRILQEQGIRTDLDDSDDTPGEKFYKWEFLGVPFRVEVGIREVAAGATTLFSRATFKRELIGLPELVQEIKSETSKMTELLRERAFEFFNSRIGEASNLEEAKHLLVSGKCLIRVPFCSTNEDGEACGAKLEELGLNVLGSKGEMPEKGSNCLICGKGAREVVYLASTM
ncbi:MAG: proline--tRNA ligase [Candidatus Bathyarchaeia archaeon]